MPTKKAYSEKDKKKFVDEFREQKIEEPDLSERKFAASKNIPRTTFVKWLKVPDLDENSESFRRKQAQFAELETELYQWFCHYKSAGGTVTANMLLVKYQQLYNDKNPSSFTGFRMPFCYDMSSTME